MGQAVKYAALGVALASILALIVVIVADLGGLIPSNGFTNAINNFISTAGSYLRSARGALNYALGSSGAIAINVLIWITLYIPILMIPIKLVIAINRFIQQ